MANKDQPCGAKPKGELLRVRKYVSGGAVYPGDFVMKENTGKVIVGAATNALIGVAINYASGADKELLVADHPDQMFVVQADEADIDAQTDILLNADIVATAGNSSYKISRHELDSSTIATTATLPLKVLGVEPRVDNALGGQVDVVVKINNHQLAGGTGTAGV